MTPRRQVRELHLTQIAALDTAVADVEARIREALVPFRAAVRLPTTMPGVSETAAAVGAPWLKTTLVQIAWAAARK